ncbi:hypothetical protein [Mangrovicoccus algicola]|uniref:Sulfotransferase family protein n=1 Tax=Mangrovicoccus algicola TaxID=2771008 RepID=A0A8J7CI18_9RHOB|nr:hypothetical protein [Mangrovicoccus algicola]MBE3639030.1 hypothetical protein [Mangrovicoccus algicola]
MTGTPEIEAIFHIGMGKTGTSALQAALRDSGAELAADSARYLGMWTEFLDPDFAGLEGFMRFARQTPARHAELAGRMAAILQEAAARDGIGRVVLSNEAYLPLFRELQPFFAALSAQLRISVIAYARPLGSWLPSACAQWGVLHKTNAGPVETLEQAGRRLVSQYARFPDWHALLGDRMTVRPYRTGTDIVEDFAALTGLTLKGSDQRRQARRPEAEQILRAAFNNRVPGPCLPGLYEDMMAAPRTGSLPPSLSGKFRFLFDYPQLEKVRTGAAPLMRDIGSRFGIDLLDDPVPDPPELRPGALSDAVLGSLVDIVAAQSLRIRALEDRLAALEAPSPEP